VPPSRTSKKNDKNAGRRRNYERKIVETGIQTFIPRGWANWVGTVMFGLITLVVFIEAIVAVGEGRRGDPVAAAVTAILLGWMTVLFARNRLKE
jgi:hypothetical protein